MITELGHFCLILALSLSVVVYLTCYKKSLGSTRSVFLLYGMRAQSLLLSLSFLCLLLAFVRSDFSVAVVAYHSHSTTPLIYKIAAVWGHHEGSMLLWCVLLSFYGVLFAQNFQKIPANHHQQILQKFQGVMLLFLIYSIFYASPFERLMPFPINKGELNSLLQDISITFHPIFLYLGFLGFVIPFAVGLSALGVGISATNFKQWTKPWIALSMGFLSFGIVSGSWWAYYELGWGGWWFWDPVESASLLPWLSAAVLLHLYRYNPENPYVQRSILFFSCFCFLLSLASVWVIRGGMVLSVHAFALAPERSMVLFMIFLASFIATFVAFFKLPKTPHQASSLWSEKSLLKSAILFLSYLLFVVCWSLFFPILFQTATAQSFSFDLSYFTKLFCYPTLGVFFLMALAPAIVEKQVDVKTFLKQHRWKFILAILSASVCFYGLGSMRIAGKLAVMASSWVIVWTLMSAITCSQVLKKIPLYGAHLGIGILALGISINEFSGQEKMATLAVGHSMLLEDVEITLEKIQPLPAGNYLAYQGTFSLKKNGIPMGILYPERRLYFATQTEHSEARILRHGLTTLSLILGETDDQKSWVVRAYTNPFIILIWIGGVLVGLSILLMVFKRKEPS
jgi:cytochrome c-type biogenesis protein CcmF